MALPLPYVQAGRLIPRGASQSSTRNEIPKEGERQEKERMGAKNKSKSQVQQHKSRKTFAHSQGISDNQKSRGLGDSLGDRPKGLAVF